MTDQRFSTVRKGYDPTEVGQALAALNSKIKSLQNQLLEQQNVVAALSAESANLKQELKQAREELEAAPDLSTASFEHLGARVGQILSIATEEAAERVRLAAEEADRRTDEGRAQAERIVADAQRHGDEIRSKAESEATRLVEEANTRADQIRADVDSEAAAARDQAASLVETQRAAATAAAIDFERTLSERRAEALAALEADVARRHEEINEATARLNEVRAEAQRTEFEARERAEQIVRSAEQRSDEVLQDAESRAEVVRQNAERELAAALARRDSVNEQLSSVRQLLSTYGASEAAEVANPMREGDGDSAQSAPSPEAETGPQSSES